jgi:hypothetical protein
LSGDLGTIWAWILMVRGSRDFNLEHHIDDERNLQHVQPVRKTIYDGQQLNKQFNHTLYGPSRYAKKNSL